VSGYAGDGKNGLARVSQRMSVSSSYLSCHPSSLTQPVTTLRQMLSIVATQAGLELPIGALEAQPNTEVRFSLYDVESFPAIVSPLKPEVWGQLLVDYPGQLSNDIQGMIRHGAKLAYSPKGHLRTESRRGTLNLPMEEAGAAHVHAEICRRLAQGQLLLAEPNEHVVTSPIGAVPKPTIDGVRKWRTIHHLSFPRRSTRKDSVNAGIDSGDVTLTYYDLESLLGELGKETRGDPDNRNGRVLWKVDLKDAYRHVVVEREDARLLGLFWPGIGFLYETQLSFGGRSAPFIFNLVAEGFEWILRSFGIDCHHYLDDSFGWLDKRLDAQRVVGLVIDIARRLGLSTAPHKTMLGPVIEILGITIDCNRGVAYISEEKLGKIRTQIRDMRTSTDLIQIQALTGSLVFVTRVCVVGRAFLRRLFDQVRVCQNAPFARRRLTQDARRELGWWKDTLLNFNAIRYLADDPLLMPELHVWSDASGSLGIGGHLENPDDEFSERIPARHEGKDILFKEALAVLRCVDLWLGKMSRHHVIFHVDNQALVAALNSGSCRHRPTQALIRRVYTLATWHSFSFRAVWLASGDNARADKLSRFMTSQPTSAVDQNVVDAHFDPDLPCDDLTLLDGDALSANLYGINDVPDPRQ
jgi:hypothetical protein